MTPATAHLTILSSLFSFFIGSVFIAIENLTIVLSLSILISIGVLDQKLMSLDLQHVQSVTDESTGQGDTFAMYTSHLSE